MGICTQAPAVIPSSSAPDPLLNLSTFEILNYLTIYRNAKSDILGRGLGPLGPGETGPRTGTCGACDLPELAYN